ncbi:type II toxin-antitoxin system VapC family toxin [Rhizobium sp.]
MSIVLDCSVTLGFLLEDERSDELARLFERVIHEGAVVPTLWYLEVANSLNVAIRRKRIDEKIRDAALADLSVFDIVADTETHLHAWRSTIQIASATGLTVYDASYLELAQRKRMPLATFDSALAMAARAAGVQIIIP